MSSCIGQAIWKLSILLALLGCLVGCSSPKEGTTGTSGEEQGLGKPPPIRVVVVDDELLAETIERQWKAASEGEIQIVNVLANNVAALQELSSVDVLIYPSPWLGELAESKKLIPISSRALNDPNYDRRDILSLDRTAAVTWGEKAYAFSFGVPQLVLMYRKDVFERLKMAPPATWNEYQQTISELAGEVGEGNFQAATVEPLAPGWASHTLLARAAAYARQRTRYWTLFDYAQMEPMIDGPPFQRALKELVAAARGAANDATPYTAREAVIAGRAVMALTWPTGHPSGADVQGVDIGFAPVPGTREVFNRSSLTWDATGGDRVARVPLFAFDGRLGSVLISAKHPREAFNFLAWLTGARRSAAICAKSSHTAPFRTSHRSAAESWLPEPKSSESAEAYFSSVSTMKSEPLSLAALRIPGRDEYLQALDRAVQDALDGQDPATALATAVDRWREITQRLDIGKQRTAYKRSLGVE